MVLVGKYLLRIDRSFRTRIENDHHANSDRGVVTINLSVIHAKRAELCLVYNTGSVTGS